MGSRMMHPQGLQIYFRPRVTLTFGLLASKVDRFILVPWTAYVHLRHNRIILVRNIAFTSLLTEERKGQRT